VTGVTIIVKFPIINGTRDGAEIVLPLSPHFDGRGHVERRDAERGRDRLRLVPAAASGLTAPRASRRR